MGTATPVAMAVTLVLFSEGVDYALVGPVGSADPVAGPDAGDAVESEGLREAEVTISYCVSNSRQIGASDVAYPSEQLRPACNSC